MLFNRAGSHEAPLSVIYIPSSTFDCFLAVYPKMKAVFACVVALVAGASAFNGTCQSTYSLVETCASS